MTNKVYFYSDDLEMNTEVIGCEKIETEGYKVVLRDTIFHPKGGGQPSDSGLIGNANVIMVYQEGDTIFHLTDKEVSLGNVCIRVAPELRNLHSRYHSAGHLISTAAHLYGLKSIKGSHSPNAARIVFEESMPSESLTAQQLQDDVNEFIFQDLPRVQYEENGVRYVSWGELPFSACGGTHSLKTSDIGYVKIFKLKNKKGQISVSYTLC